MTFLALKMDLYSIWQPNSHAYIGPFLSCHSFIQRLRIVILVLFSKVGQMPLKHRHFSFQPYLQYVLIKTYMVWTILCFSPSLLVVVSPMIMILFEQQTWQSMLNLEAGFCFVINSRNTLYLKNGNCFLIWCCIKSDFIQTIYIYISS